MNVCLPTYKSVSATVDLPHVVTLILRSHSSYPVQVLRFSIRILKARAVHMKVKQNCVHCINVNE
jgi:hypothetical protein